MRVVVLGAGFGGLELATQVARSCPDSADVVLIDQSDGFVFGFSKLDVMTGRASVGQVLHRYEDITTPGLRFVAGTVQAIDPTARVVDTTAGRFTADVLVVALGADLDPFATSGLLQAGHEFYTVPGAAAVAAALARFEGGRVVIGVTSTPFKCPPAPSEAALAVDRFLSARGVRARSQITVVMPFGSPIPPSPQASAAVLGQFAERSITWKPDRLVRALDGSRRVALLSDGEELGFDLFLGVPVHRVPRVVSEAGMTEDGWVPVDPLTLRTRFPGVYAVGDVTSVGTPKAGVFAEGQAAVAAAHIVAQIRGLPCAVEYDGAGVCYLDFGDGRVATVDVTFRAGRPPTGDLRGPSADLMADKAAFGADRVRRWFGREWQRTVAAEGT